MNSGRYRIPPRYYFKLHHPRPRFKNDLENVLGHVAFGIAIIDCAQEETFNNELMASIREYGDNPTKSDKTLANWRTEISALFSFYYTENEITYATSVAKDLADTLNFPYFFRRFITTLQYPGGFLASNFILEVIQESISFHPGKWLAEFFSYCDENDSDQSFLTAQEFSQCVLNDMRVTRDHEQVEDTYNRIVRNRRRQAQYISSGDEHRYAKDILDYMVLARILRVDYRGRFRVDPQEGQEFLENLLESDHLFSEYQTCQNDPEINALRSDWVKYVEQTSSEFMGEIQEEIQEKETSEDQEVIPEIEDIQDVQEIINTTEIGNLGENLSLIHEKIRLDEEGRPDLVHLVKKIPTHLAVGYDISSVEITEEPRYIEVKTSISQNELTFNRFHLTTNEWVKAESLGDHYFIYRLQILDDKKTLFIIRNPVQKYKNSELRMIPRNGADIIFDNSCGDYMELYECDS